LTNAAFRDAPFLRAGVSYGSRKLSGKTILDTKPDSPTPSQFAPMSISVAPRVGVQFWASSSASPSASALASVQSSARRAAQ
jgi:hypothetical protein